MAGLLSLPIMVQILLIPMGYLLCLTVYRLYLHPLAKFPGPKLAALTKWYEAYYEIWPLNGKFSFHIEDLHKQYGPIVRITPFEIHIKDPTFWDTLYVKHNKSSKYEWMSGRFGNADSVFSTSDHALHKMRRAPLNYMFSRKAIMNFEPIVQKKLEIFCRGLEKFKETGSVCTIEEAFSAFAGDVVMNYSFGWDYDHLSLLSDGIADSFHKPFMANTAFGHVTLQFPWVPELLKRLPQSWTAARNPGVAKITALRKDLGLSIAAERAKVENGEKLPEYPTIFHTLLVDETLPESEKTNLRFAHEAQLFLGAGIETTNWALCQTFYYVLSNPSILNKLKEELRTAIPDISAPDAFAYTKLEALPYLRGCLKEGVRLSVGVSARNPRVLSQPLPWRDWVIPAGTPISMTNADALLNDDYFVDAMAFKPERWLGDFPRAPDGEPLEKYFVVFGKGPRSCLGINLAWMELFLAAGTLFRKFDFQLYQTDITDVLLAHDFFIPSPKLDSKGIRVKVKGLEH